MKYHSPQNTIEIRKAGFDIIIIQSACKEIGIVGDTPPFHTFWVKYSIYYIYYCWGGLLSHVPLNHYSDARNLRHAIPMVRTTCSHRILPPDLKVCFGETSPLEPICGLL